MWNPCVPILGSAAKSSVKNPRWAAHTHIGYLSRTMHSRSDSHWKAGVCRTTRGAHLGCIECLRQIRCQHGTETPAAQFPADAQTHPLQLGTPEDGSSYLRHTQKVRGCRVVAVVVALLQLLMSDDMVCGGLIVHLPGSVPRSLLEPRWRDAHSIRHWICCQFASRCTEQSQSTSSSAGALPDFASFRVETSWYPMLRAAMTPWKKPRPRPSNCWPYYSCRIRQQM